MGYNKSLGIHGIFKKERFTEETYKALSYLETLVMDELKKDVENTTKDTKMWGTTPPPQSSDGSYTIELEYAGPVYLSSGNAAESSTPFKRQYKAKMSDPAWHPPSIPTEPVIYFKDEADHEDYIFKDNDNIYNPEDVINNIADTYAKKIYDADMSITLDNNKIVINEMNDEEKKVKNQRLQDEKNEADLWASRSESIEHVQKNTRIVKKVGSHTEHAHMTDPIRKDYPEGYVDLEYEGNTYRYAITFSKCEPRNTTSCSWFESEIVAKAGTDIYIISKDLFEKLDINDLIFEKGERADNIESLREVLYTLSQRPIPEESQTPISAQTSTPAAVGVWIITLLVGAAVVLCVMYIIPKYNKYIQSKKAQIPVEAPPGAQIPVVASPGAQIPVKASPGVV